MADLIYVASSWRNRHQPGVVAFLREAGAEVYDFRNPKPDDHGFSWSEIDPDWQSWTPEQYRDALAHPIAARGFGFDLAALEACSACLLVEPCGRSAHLELGFAAGAGKHTAVWFDAPPATCPNCDLELGTSSSERRSCPMCFWSERCEPELMLKVSELLIGPLELRDWVRRFHRACDDAKAVRHG